MNILLVHLEIIPVEVVFWIQYLCQKPTTYGRQYRVKIIDIESLQFLNSFVPITTQDFTQFTLLPIQIHAIIFALFASLLAPFGGFFASGLKRAFNVKDFADAIPGHGGITDRMDCQFMMGVFANMYYTSFISGAESIEETLVYLIGNYSLEELTRLYNLLGEHLVAKGAVL